MTCKQASSRCCPNSGLIATFSNASPILQCEPHGHVYTFTNSLHIHVYLRLTSCCCFSHTFSFCTFFLYIFLLYIHPDTCN